MSRITIEVAKIHERSRIAVGTSCKINKKLQTLAPEKCHPINTGLLERYKGKVKDL